MIQIGNRKNGDGIMIPKILIVDDSSFARSKIKKSLSSLNIEILEASSGEQAIQMTKEYKPDIITLDLLMPEMTGQTALAAIRAFNKDVKVIIVSADIQVQTQAELFNSGAVSFLNKPVIAEELLKTVEALLP